MDSEQKRMIGDRLAMVRASKRLSQKAMGELLGVPWRTYQNYETGAREMPVDFALEYCKQLGTRIEWLIRGEGGQHAVDDLSAFKQMLIETDNQARQTGDPLKLEAIADISVRLLRKQRDGYAVTQQDFDDYIELKREV